MGARIFSNCTALKRMWLGGKSEDIGAQAFERCTALEEIVLEGDGVPTPTDKVGAYAFAHCAGVKRIVFGPTLRSLDRGVFMGCTSLTRVELPVGNLSALGPKCFSDCTALEHVEFPDNMRNLEEACFANCTSLKYASIPPHCPLGQGAFPKWVEFDRRVDPQDEELERAYQAGEVDARRMHRA